MAPNPIDFDKVFIEFTRLPETGNVSVIIAVSCVFGLHLVLFIWARKTDKEDTLRVCAQKGIASQASPCEIPCHKGQRNLKTKRQIEKIITRTVTQFR